jgi:hypothetical protein
LLHLARGGFNVAKERFMLMLVIRNSSIFAPIIIYEKYEAFSKNNNLSAQQFYVRVK